MLFQHTISTVPFKEWLFKDGENKKLIWFTLVVAIASFTWMKIVYPYPNFMPPDSYSYIQAAHDNLFINIWPIGYSKFLRLISSFSQSHFILVLLQYLLLLASTFYSLLTIRYLLSPGKWVFRITLTISIINPLLAHIANFVSSDCLFAALSLIWFTQLLWILITPSRKLLTLHAIVLLFAFMIRFMALYYPLISFVVIIFSRMPAKTRYYGIGIICLLLFLFIGRTQYEYTLQTNTIQYSAFAGWLMAANALYGYAHARPDDPTTVPSRFKELHTLVNYHLDSLKHLGYWPYKDIGVYYQWDLKSPLILYAELHWKNDRKNTPYFKTWAAMGPLYQAYGRWLMTKHPKEFIQYYLWPNLIRYYQPPANFMGFYNLGNNTVESTAVNWFGWKSNQLPLRSKDRIIHVTNFLPKLVAIINSLFLLVSIAFIFLGGFNKCHPLSKKVVSITALIWLSNMVFSIFSAPIELRYQMFPIIITLPLFILLITWIVQSLETQPTQKQEPEISISKSFSS